ncbi:hypothetical protein [Rhodococcus sp. USK13]|jgi:hypothetical protein|uniref:hypothetical protein n=1 Tax=Rhodococcus sp. USK13 TaxID=2806442 RepID=UPI001BCF850A|nr:hypothetical protein [Rhodococcus sp. USK13]
MSRIRTPSTATPERGSHARAVAANSDVVGPHLRELAGNDTVPTDFASSANPLQGTPVRARHQLYGLYAVSVRLAIVLLFG